jgi:hypothetical protein
MKKQILNLGKALSKAEQKEVLGGLYYYDGGCMSNCSTQCYNAMVGFGSKRFECRPTCSSPTLKQCIIYV